MAESLDDVLVFKKGKKKEENSSNEKPKKKTAKKDKNLSSSESSFPTSSESEVKPKKKSTKKAKKDTSSESEEVKPKKKKASRKKATKVKKDISSESESSFPTSSDSEVKPKKKKASRKKATKVKKDISSESESSFPTSSESEEVKPKKKKASRKKAKKAKKDTSSESESSFPTSSESEEVKPKKKKASRKKAKKAKKDTSSDSSFPSSSSKDEEKINSDGDCVERSKLPLKEHQKLIVNHIRNQRGILAIHALGSGKCHGINTPILMYNGKIKMVQDIKVGDKLMGDDSTPRNVLSLARGREEMFKIIQQNGDDYVVNKSHILCLKYNNKTIDMKLTDYQNLNCKNDFNGFKVGVEFPFKNTLFDPYILGTQITTHISKSFKINDRQFRLRLLEGIMNKNGKYIKDHFEIPKINKTLTKDIEFLARSLGFLVHTSNTINIFDNHNLQYKIKIQSLGEGDYYGFVLDGNHRYLLGDFTVSHNTLSAVSASQCYLDDNPDGTVIIITPTSLQANFKKEMKQYDPKISFSNYKFYTIDGFSRAMTKKQVKCDNTMVILDEAHNLRTATSAKKTKSGAPTKGKRAGNLLTCTGKASKVMLLTATPVVNEPYDLANLLSMINGDEPMHKKDFINLYNDENAFNDAFRCKISIYNPPKDEIKKFYPNFEIHHEFIPMPKEYEKKYIQVEQEQSDLYQNPNMFYNGVRRASNKLDDTITSPKIVWLKYFLQENETGKIVIFSHWLDAGIKPVKEVLDELDISYAHIDGGVKPDERSEAVKDYNNDEIRVLLITKAGGEGLDLKGTRYMILLDPGWNPGVAEQVIGRGIRFKSHTHLPKDEQMVDVYRLYLVKHRDAELFEQKSKGKTVNENPSVDKYLYNLALSKEQMIKNVIDRLKPLSIENNEC